jgi:hypothetical protein
MTVDHLSYSQYNSYVKCPRSWYLGKVRQAEEKQTWYIPIGSAFHNWIEDRLKGGPEKTTEEYFYPLIEAQMEIEPDTTKWLAGGKKDDPIVEDKALALLTQCQEKAVEWLQDFEVWEVEYDATGSLPGCPVPIVAFVDVIGEHKKHGPSIVDWKTGKNKDRFQLETYAALLKHSPQPTLREADFNTGLFAMVAPGASLPRPIDLSKVSPKEVGAKYRDVYHKMLARMYGANQGFDCRFCFHQDNCLANQTLATRRALYYDRSSRDEPPY